METVSAHSLSTFVLIGGSLVVPLLAFATYYWSGASLKKSTGIAAGESVIIIWALDSLASFTWELNLLDQISGDVCEDPLIAATGANTALNAPAWYSYTVPEDGAVRISSVGSQIDTYLVVYDLCDGNVLAENDDVNDDFESEVILENMVQDSELLIGWLPIWTSEGFSWSVEPFNPALGASCEEPLQAMLGTNTAPSAPSWYSFVMPQSGSILISSVGTTTEDTYLNVYLDCISPPVAFNDDFDFDRDIYQSQARVSNLNQGDTVLIEWTDDWSAAAFAWEISLNDDPLAVERYQLIVYPNPAHDYIVIKSAMPVYNVQLFSLDGMRHGISINENKLGVSGLKSGIYLLQMEIGEQQVQRKILIEN